MQKVPGAEVPGDEAMQVVLLEIRAGGSVHAAEDQTRMAKRCCQLRMWNQLRMFQAGGALITRHALDMKRSILLL